MSQEISTNAANESADVSMEMKRPETQTVNEYKMKHVLINKNILEALKEIPDESIDCIITSPPYYGLRSYKGADTVWDGDKNCQHDFNDVDNYHDNLRYRGENSIIRNEKNQEIHPIATRRPNASGGHNSKKLQIKETENFQESVDYDNRITTSYLCSRCGAWKGQLGLEPSYEMYLGHLMLITKELKRVLKETGTMFWNVGDSYTGNTGNRGGWPDSKYSVSKEEAIENGQAIFMKADYGNIQQKSLMLLPERFAIRMVDDGWILRNKLIWYKRNAMPSSVKDRFSNKYEFVYFFSRSKKYYFDLDAVRKPLTESTWRRISEKNLDNQFQEGKVAEMAQFSGTGNMKKALVNLRSKSFNIRVRDAQNYHVQKYENEGAYQKKHNGYFNEDGSLRINTDGVNPGDVILDDTVNFFRNRGSGGNYDYGGINSDDASHYNENGTNPGDVMDIPTMRHSFAHFAIFPERLVEPLIKAGCPKDGIVLDPFAGSGTTGVVARKLGRSSVQIEISEEYCKIIKERMQCGSGSDIEREKKRGAERGQME